MNTTEAKAFLADHKSAFLDDAQHDSLLQKLGSIAVKTDRNRYRFSDGSMLIIDPMACSVVAAHS